VGGTITSFEPCFHGIRWLPVGVTAVLRNHGPGQTYCAIPSATRKMRHAPATGPADYAAPPAPRRQIQPAFAGAGRSWQFFFFTRLSRSHHLRTPARLVHLRAGDLDSPFNSRPETAQFRGALQQRGCVDRFLPRPALSRWVVPTDSGQARLSANGSASV
jgi:hypothetical protein